MAIERYAAVVGRDQPIVHMEVKARAKVFIQIRDRGSSIVAQTLQTNRVQHTNFLTLQREKYPD